MSIFETIKDERTELPFTAEEMRALILAAIVRIAGGTVEITNAELAETLMVLGDISIQHEAMGNWIISVTSIREEETENAQN